MNEDRPVLRVGVLGTGNMGRNHVRVLSTMPEYQLVGCYDASSEACKAQASLYGIRAFSSPEELFDACDVVNVATPSFLHKEHAIAAAMAGCHVLVEKPIALNAEDAQDIIDACAGGGCVFVSGMWSGSTLPSRRCPAYWLTRKSCRSTSGA